MMLCNQFVLKKERAQRSDKFYRHSNEVKWTIVGKEQPTEFTGYKKHSSKGKIISNLLFNI